MWGPSRVVLSSESWRSHRAAARLGETGHCWCYLGFSSLLEWRPRWSTACALTRSEGIPVLGFLAHEGAVLSVLRVEFGIEAALQELGEEGLRGEIDFLQMLRSVVDLHSLNVGQLGRLRRRLTYKFKL